MVALATLRERTDPMPMIEQTAVLCAGSEDITELIIGVLNRALKADQKAVSALLSTRVPCNEELANDPTILVREDTGAYSVSVLNLIDGLIEPREDGIPKIAVIRGDNGLIESLMRVCFVSQEYADMLKNKIRKDDSDG